MRVRFWGTRGSLPVPRTTHAAYGGNTSCVQVMVEDDRHVVVLDAGFASAGKRILTFPAALPMRALDHIFYRGDVRSDHVFAPRSQLARQASDHLPLIADFELLSGADDLSVYRFGDDMVNHNFCRHCGIYPYHGDDQHGYRINLGCVDAIDDAHALPVRVFDGRDTWTYID